MMMQLLHLYEIQSVMLKEARIGVDLAHPMDCQSDSFFTSEKER
jgi:hypothetical protein